MPETHALVLGGGGVTGTSWTVGILTGLADQGRDLRDADLIVWTSAGSTVGAQLGSGLSYGELFALQADPARQTREVAVQFDLREFGGRMAAARAEGLSYLELRKLVGKWALEADTPAEAVRRAVIAARLPSHKWPAQRLVAVAVDAETGIVKLFDRDSGVDLVDAVTASTSVPGAWPPATVDGHRYLDGAMRSPDNADYAEGFDHVTIISPVGSADPFPVVLSLDEQVARLRYDGTRVDLIVPDEASRAAIGNTPLDLDGRAPAATAGRAQGRALQLGR
jgi:NTE family protein